MASENEEKTKVPNDEPINRDASNPTKSISDFQRDSVKDLYNLTRHLFLITSSYLLEDKAVVKYFNTYTEDLCERISENPKLYRTDSILIKENFKRLFESFEHLFELYGVEFKQFGKLKHLITDIIEDTLH